MYEMQFLRILTHGKVTDISDGFKLPDGRPFSVYVRPKSSTDNVDTVVNAKCIGDSAASAIPVPLNAWSEAAIVELGANSVNLSNYDVYWGAGSKN